MVVINESLVIVKYVTSAKSAHHSTRHHDDGNNHSVKSNSFSENEDEDHTNENVICLGISSYSSISSDTNGES